MVPTSTVHSLSLLLPIYANHPLLVVGDQDARFHDRVLLAGAPMIRVLNP